MTLKSRQVPIIAILSISTGSGRTITRGRGDGCGVFNANVTSGVVELVKLARIDGYFPNVSVTMAVLDEVRKNNRCEIYVRELPIVPRIVDTCYDDKRILRKSLVKAMQLM